MTPKLVLNFDNTLNQDGMLDYNKADKVLVDYNIFKWLLYRDFIVFLIDQIIAAAEKLTVL